MINLYNKGFLRGLIFRTVYLIIKYPLQHIYNYVKQSFYKVFVLFNTVKSKVILYINKFKYRVELIKIAMEMCKDVK